MLSNCLEYSSSASPTHCFRHTCAVTLNCGVALPMAVAQSPASTAPSDLDFGSMSDGSPVTCLEGSSGLRPDFGPWEGVLRTLLRFPHPQCWQILRARCRRNLLINPLFPSDRRPPYWLQRPTNGHRWPTPAWGTDVPPDESIVATCSRKVRCARAGHCRSGEACSCGCSPGLSPASPSGRSDAATSEEQAGKVNGLYFLGREAGLTVLVVGQRERGPADAERCAISASAADL